MFTGPVAEKVGDLIGLGDTFVTVWGIVKWPILLLIVSFMISLLYWACPNVKQPGFPWVTPGGLLAVVLWLVASALFALYVANFSLLQQDLRQPRRRDRVPHLAVDHEHHHPARGRVQFRDGAQPGDPGGHPPDKEPYLPLRDEPKD